MRHLVSIDDIGYDILLELFDTATNLTLSSAPQAPLRGFILTNLFYEPSTRTSSSFHAAMLKLGGSVIPINEVQYSSVTKGENLEDTIRTIGSYSDIIVLRSPNIGDAEIAASVSSVPIINAGDGAGEHPTQTLLDLYTIYKKYNRISNLNIVLAGDIKNGRTVHSLAKVLEKDNNLIFCEHYDDTLIDNLSDADVVYMTRLQTERGTEGYYTLTEEMINQLNTNAIVMHPFPRNREIPQSFDSDERAVYFDQMENGLWIRMALLLKILLGDLN